MQYNQIMINIYAYFGHFELTKHNTDKGADAVNGFCLSGLFRTFSTNGFLLDN